MTELRPFALSAHIGYLFCELPLAERIGAARAAGFDAVEHPNPFFITTSAMRGLLDDNGLSFTQIGAASGDASKGEKGLTALPGRSAEFLVNFKRSVDYAEAIHCPFVHPMAGIPPASAGSDAIADTYFRNIDAALRVLEGRPVKLLVEAISHSGVPGYYMHRLSQALALSRSYAPGQVSVLLDTFHARANGENALAIVADNANRIGHVHIADHPGRHEPGSGDIDFTAFTTELRDSGYAGALGFEYVPTTGTLDGLGWLPTWHPLANRSLPHTASNQDTAHDHLH